MTSSARGSIESRSFSSFSGVRMQKKDLNKSARTVMVTPDTCALAVFASFAPLTLETRERCLPLAPLPAPLANRPAFPPLLHFLPKSHVRGSNRLENS